MIIIICTAAGAAVTAALTAPSGTGGTVEACFVDASVYESLTQGREEEPFDASLLSFEGSPLPFDENAGILYIPQSPDAPDWEGALHVSRNGSRICILCEDGRDRLQLIREGEPLKLAVVSRKKYMECSLIFTGLPVIAIEYEGDEPGKSEDTSGTIHVLDPSRKEYQSALCAFHVRGNTSVLFDKKSYRVELRDSRGNTIDKSFLGLRSDDDWILNSLSTDRSLVREKSAYELWEKLNEWEDEPVPSAKIQYAELFMNGVCRGVYGLMFPVDGKLMNMKQGDILYKVRTWHEEMDIEGKLTDHNGESEALNSNGFAYASIQYPGSDSGPYIWDPFQSYQDMVFETGDREAMERAGVTLHMDNFILHELFCEMTRAGDNTWKNLFLAAYADGRGGYRISETVWDLNYTFGDSFYWDPDHGNTYFFEDGTENYKLRYDRDYGYAALELQDPGIRTQTAAKWRRWREQGIDPSYVSGLLDQNRDELIRSGAASRNDALWNNGEEYEGGPAVREWISRRFAFLDQLYEKAGEENGENSQ